MTEVVGASCGGEDSSRSSKSWARNTSGDGKESTTPIVEALFLALMAAARVGRGVTKDDATEIPVDGAVVDVDTVAGVTMEVEAACRAGVST